ncbi:hypothetical protein KKP04_14565 [Rhodomicrobium sp. Az07]|uniref:hypothetical protein n=1 Tax=Rhodomicrobium sp. Az07 TaxID=2839034 RepID=UPI001BE8B93F|nr:hypothetical protein [Rhodomicrobium sp. Az07]MBT3072080.1 hypothetical protein [Rhodomicrobium sp. Az07]
MWSATVLAAEKQPETSAARDDSANANATAEKARNEAQQPKITPDPAPTEAENAFLDRLMRAESGGRQFAKNPLSSALGPYQFIESTFLDVVKRNLPDLAAGKTDFEILALRTDYAISRTAALLYTRENAAALAEQNQPATPANLRLAFFAGAATALKVLEAEPEERVSGIFSEAAMRANPFLASMTARQLIERSAREADRGGAVTVALSSGKLPVSAAPQKPRIAVRCNLRLASCRKWLALAEARLNARTAPLKTAVKASQKQP